MVPCCWRYNRVSTENYIYIISGCRKYICGKGALGGEDLPPPEANDIWKYQIKWNHFHHMGPEFFFFTIFEAILFFSTPLVPFYFFLHIKNQNIKKTTKKKTIKIKKKLAPPPPAQSDQHLCCSLPRKYDISSIYIGNFITLASFFSWADRFESYLVENPEDRLSRDEAHMGKILLFNLSS